MIQFAPARLGFVVALAVALAVVLALVGAPSAQALDPQTLEGHVTDTSGTPVEGMQIDAYSGPEYYSTTTDADGYYQFTGLVDTRFSVSNPYGSTVWQYQRFDNVDVVSGAAVDFHLVAVPVGTATLSGTVTDRPTNDPIPFASVTANGPFGYYLTVSTDVDGHYEFSSLVAGTYSVSAYKTDFTPGAPNWSSSVASIAVAEGASKVRDFQLKRAASGTGIVTGRITDEGAPVVGLTVFVNTVAAGAGTLSVTTDSDGVYTKTGLPAGNYAVGFADPGGPFTPIYQPPAWASTLARLATDSSTATVDLSLIKFRTGTGSVHGVVTDTRTGAPVQGAEISVNGTTADIHGGSATTDATGSWSVTDLADGTYAVSISTFMIPGSAFEYDFDTAPLVITGGANVSRSDTVTSIVAGTGALSGRVRDLVTHRGIPALDVSVSMQSGTYSVPGTTTDGAGNYAFGDLPAGKYAVQISGDGYVGTTFRVEIGTGASEVNVSLATAEPVPTGTGTVTGTVTDSSGEPIVGAFTSVELPDGRGVFGAGTNASTDSDGHFELTGLPLRDLVVRVFGPPAPPGSGQSFGPFRGEVSLSATVTDVVLPVALHPASSVAGTVTIAGGATVPYGIMAFALDPVNGELQSQANVQSPSGAYSLENLAGGNHVIQFRSVESQMQGAEPVSFAPAYWNDVDPAGTPLRENALPVTLGVDDRAEGIDMVLSPGGFVSGNLVVETTGGEVPLPVGKSVNIRVFKEDGGLWVEQPSLMTWTGSADLDPDEFLVQGLAEGTYRLLFTDEWEGNRALAAEYYGDSATLGNGTDITVHAGSTVHLGDISMSPQRPSEIPDTLDLEDLDADDVDDLEGQVSTNDETPEPGDELTIDVGEEYAGEWMAAWANSTPTAMSDWVQVSAAGTIVARVPAGLAGAHRVVVQDADQAAVGWAPITVSVASSSSGGSAAAPHTRPLVRVGSTPSGAAPVASASPTATPKPPSSAPVTPDAPEQPEVQAESPATPAGFDWAPLLLLFGAIALVVIVASVLLLRRRLG